ncbi:MAG: polyribonucleotide nucleotidyltransferase [Candidatus Melainabacteria bacterium RIFOXYA12_FULL_32_12]|nr:MAG: polyribonucleotide nucleotidyltransferase [Candidatus Melainabacteria bacterium RIFOXYA2_FULL_32_9]OGI30029.1 MAG: polyribonucleotide nucleotidyltransferase [Candidatus Melainabacteria bacterium RIFOXYA12_FULL_32_12]
MDSIQKYTLKIGERTVEFETGRLAKQAAGSVTISCEGTVLLVSVTVNEEPRPGIDFFPLLVDYEEKMYSVGKIPGGFLRKEGRPSDKAILTSRLIDRPIRPLFPKGFRNDVQIVAATLSSDRNIQPDTLAILGASTALELSGAPFQGPIGAVRVAKVNDKFIANPTYEEADYSALDIVIAGTEDSVLMVEAGCDFVPEEEIFAAVEFALPEIKKQVEAQRAFAAQCGVTKKEFVNPHDTTELHNLVEEVAAQLINEAYHNFDRDARKEKLKQAKELVNARIQELPEENSIKQLLASSEIKFVNEEFKSVEKKIMRNMVINEGVRADGRKYDEIRPITVEVGVLPRTHGSAVFTRGATQALSVATLGSPGEAQELDGLSPETTKRYMHHYSFPGYATGEVRPMRGAGRREIGHGALAERAILPALPSKDIFPYTLRVNSDILESNGSSSMASTCGSCLALMDAGVPITTVVGGVAMGLVKEGDKTAILTDIQGLEDFLGDMDFKVTGNKEGISALQMDMKIKGIDFEILKRAINDAKVGRNFIIDKMIEVIPEPRKEMSPFAPRIHTMKIDVESIGAVIGPGGKTIRGIIEETGVTIDIEDDGTVLITSANGPATEKAISIIGNLTRKITEGLIVRGKVVRTIPIGAFVELAPGKDGMVHISQISKERIARVEDAINVGDEVVVKVMSVDEKGRVNLTIKGVTEEEKAHLIKG